MEFGTILRMDWLSANSAHVGCNGKRIIFKMGVPEFIFEGVKISHVIPIISDIRATKLMSQGCPGFLASVLDTNVTNIKIETIPIVNEFPYVFSEDLPGLSPDHNVEFTIDLLPTLTRYLKHHIVWPPQR